MAQEDGWDLTGIPKKFWPKVKNVLLARELFRLSGTVEDRELSENMGRFAKGLLER